MKILDFGLAKLTDPETTGMPVTERPAATAGMEARTVFGTIRLHVARACTRPGFDATSPSFNVAEVLK